MDQQVTPTQGANNGGGSDVHEQILLMTRPRAASDAFVARLDPLVLRHTQVIVAPLIDIVPVGACPSLADVGGVIFTSANGVAAAPLGAGLPAYCVGARTADAALRRGYAVKQTAQDADDLVARFDAGTVRGALVHLSGAHRRGEIAQRLTALGVPVSVHVLYDQPLQPLSDEAKDIFAGEVPVILPLFSPRTSAHLASQRVAAPRTTVIALSDAVAQPLPTQCFASVEVAAYPTGKEMVQHVEKQLRRDSLS